MQVFLRRGKGSFLPLLEEFSCWLSSAATSGMASSLPLSSDSLPRPPDLQSLPVRLRKRDIASKWILDSLRAFLRGFMLGSGIKTALNLLPFLLRRSKHRLSWR